MSGRDVPRIESLKFSGPAGVLEGILHTPASTLEGAALLCHPHPLHGGSMHSAVVFRAARAFHRRNRATLRFNFRGVGLSSGSFDSGRGEMEDVRAALDLLAGRLPDLPLTVAGYSFGSWVGLEAVGGDPRVLSLVGIGIPLTLAPFNFLRRVEKPVLIVQGTNDEFGPLPSVRRLIAELGSKARLVTLPGADHLFTGELGRLEESLYAAMTV